MNLISCYTGAVFVVGYGAEFSTQDNEWQHFLSREMSKLGREENTLLFCEIAQVIINHHYNLWYLWSIGRNVEIK
ncbi:hypothetical protein [Umezakia ovalisporum]|uniref:hypothetical protein n=1 Tax=Umezakia ovalisporum TaxID=75695 RepID=UPI0024738BA6|nr:hypothetical protein [Umezakia ovalisporum]MDH6084052.1 hypothetical protein [Umezakia ovalisporum TAC611]